MTNISKRKTEILLSGSGNFIAKTEEKFCWIISSDLRSALFINITEKLFILSKAEKYYQRENIELSTEEKAQIPD